jgi:diguanylate cyclase (GGDEF)-like protein
MKIMRSVRARLVMLCGLFLVLLAASNLYLAGLAGVVEARWVVAGALLTGVLLTAIAVLSIVQPLNVVLRALRRTAAGDHAAPLPPPREDEFGEMTRALRQIQDYSARLDSLAYTDALTGLDNRASLERDLAAGVAGAAARGQAVAVMFLDLDNFKSVNDTLGHAMGDRYLLEAALRLRRLLPKGAVLYHYSGDEFALTLSGLADDARLRARVQELAASLLEGMSEAYEVEEHRLAMSVSIGAALYPQDGADAEALIGAAEAAMFEAKRAGRNQLLFSAREHTAALRRQLELAGEIRRGLDAGEFEPWFQPIIDTASNRAVGAEALARWQHPQRGIVMPLEFVPVAEESGAISQLGEQVLRRGAEAMARLNGRADGMRLSVNLSARQLRDASLVGSVGQMLHLSGLPPQRIELEITESAVMENIERNTRTLLALRRLGVSLALDDFGTGYSSLSYVQRLPVSKLKIDRSFVAQLGISREAEAIILATLAMARSLGLDVVAEGVETRAQSQQLLALGCTQQQGFLFTPALPAEQLGEWLTATGRAPTALH